MHLQSFVSPVWISKHRRLHSVAMCYSRPSCQQNSVCHCDVSPVRLLDLFFLSLFEFLLFTCIWWNWLPVAQSESPSGRKGRFKWLKMWQTQLFVPDGLPVFHTLLQIHWEFHCIFTVPGGLQEVFPKMRKEKQNKTSSWWSITKNMYCDLLLEAEQSFHREVFAKKKKADTLKT